MAKPLRYNALDVIRAATEIATPGQAAILGMALFDTEIARLKEKLRHLKGEPSQVGVRFLQVQAQLEATEAARETMDLIRRRVFGEALPQPVVAHPVKDVLSST